MARLSSFSSDGISQSGIPPVVSHQILYKVYKFCCHYEVKEAGKKEERKKWSACLSTLKTQSEVIIIIINHLLSFSLHRNSTQGPSFRLMNQSSN